MHNLDQIADRIRANFAAKNSARDTALERSRTLIRHCANAIRANLASYPDLYHAGYTQDALKEFAEANIVYALVGSEPLPEPEAIGVEYAAYLNGLGEAAGELRRRCLDIIRHDQ